MTTFLKFSRTLHKHETLRPQRGKLCLTRMPVSFRDAASTLMNRNISVSPWNTSSIVEAGTQIKSPRQTMQQQKAPTRALTPTLTLSSKSFRRAEEKTSSSSSNAGDPPSAGWSAPPAPAAVSERRHQGGEPPMPTSCGASPPPPLTPPPAFCARSPALVLLLLLLLLL